MKRKITKTPSGKYFISCENYFISELVQLSTFVYMCDKLKAENVTYITF